MQVNLALCCKAMLPLLWTGVVSVRLDKPGGGRSVTQLSRCLAQHPDGVSHLRLFTKGNWRHTRKLIDLRCAHAAAQVLEVAWACPRCASASIQNTLGGDLSQLWCVLSQSAVQPAPAVPEQRRYLPASPPAGCLAIADFGGH